MKRKRLIACIACILAVWLAGADDGLDPRRHVTARPVKVACVGDSITSGYALKNPARDAFPAQLQRILGDGYEVRNFGMPGLGVYRHTKWNGGMRAWSLSKAHPAVLDWQPDVVLCGLGINDIEEYPKDASGTFRRQYTELLAGFAALPSAPRLIVWTRLGPLGSKHRHYGSKVPFAMEGDLAAAAASVGAEPFDAHAVLGPFAETHMPDGIHPDPDGAAALARACADALRGGRPAKTVYDAALYSQIPLNHITDANRARYLADVRAAGVETVLLSVCDFFEQGTERRVKLDKLATEIRFFRKAGVPTMVWSNGFGYGYPQTGTPGGKARFTGAQPLVGVEGRSNGALCPLDPAMRAHLKELVRDVAAAGAEFFLMDDDYVQSARGRLGCACPLHLARISAKCGRPVTRDDVRASFAGAPNVVRTAFVDVQGEVAVELARELRAEVDKVNPSMGMGICLSYTHWDIEGAEMDDLLSAFAGPKGRKVVRLSGAPYWGDGRFNGVGLEGFIENVRMQAEWTRGTGWTVFDENDPYPRKVAKVPAWRCELYDKATIADGLSARHKYMLCYGPDKAEPGYLEAHLASRADDVRLRALFADTEPYGVYAPFPRRQIREVTLPAQSLGEDRLTGLFSQNLGAVLLLRSGIPVRHAPASDAYALDPKTLGVDLWEVDYAAVGPDLYRQRILDAAAADGKPLAVHVETASPRIYQVVRRNPAEKTFSVLLENMGDAPADIRIAAKGRTEVLGAVHGPFASMPEGGLRTVLPAHAWAAVRFRLVDGSAASQKTCTTENGSVREEFLAKGALPPERQELIPLPFGSITARGWIRTMLERSRDGMGGHFGEFDADQFDKPFQTREYDAKLVPGKDHENPGWCAEMAGEFRLGQVELAETLEDEGLRKRFRSFLEATLALQEPDGYLGSYRKTDNRQEDYNAWGCHFLYRAILLEYSRTGDRRLLDALHRGLLWFARNWAGSKKTDYAGPTIIWPMVEVYRLTGDSRLLKFCEDYAKFLNDGAQWNPYRKNWPNQTGGFNRFSHAPHAYHVVAYAVRAQLPGILSLANGDEELKKASYWAFDDHVKTVGWQATYVPSSHMEHTGPAGCTLETEYCNFLCWMEYLQWLSRISGDARFGDAIERMAFNAAMGARKKDERAIAYNSSPNQFRATKTSATGGCKEYYEAYTPCLFAACCPAQSIRLMPAYLLKAVMKDRLGDLVVNAYGPCHVATKEVSLDFETQYPFEDSVRIRVEAPQGWTGSLRLRLPEWSKGWTVLRNGKPLDVKSSRRWLTVKGPWMKDELHVSFRNVPVIRVANEVGMREPLRTVEYGPLVFAQPLKTTWTPCKWEYPTRPLPDGWPWYEATCAEKPAIYALPVETAFNAAKIRVKRVPGGYPWENPPLRLVVPMVRATAAYPADPERQTHNPAPMQNPAPMDAGARLEDVELVPMGATNLRLTCFPLGVK